MLSLILISVNPSIQYNCFHLRFQLQTPPHPPYVNPISFHPKVLVKPSPRLRKQQTFLIITTGFPIKGKTEEQMQKFLTITRYFPDLGYASGSLKICFIQTEVLSRSEYSLSCTHHTTFCEETSGGIVKC